MAKSHVQRKKIESETHTDGLPSKEELLIFNSRKPPSELTPSERAAEARAILGGTYNIQNKLLCDSRMRELCGTTLEEMKKSLIEIAFNGTRMSTGAVAALGLGVGGLAEERFSKLRAHVPSFSARHSDAPIGNKLSKE